MERRLLIVDYLYMIFMGDGNKHQPQYISQLHEGLERYMVESREVNSMKVYEANYETSH
jgi:hypothetical protein